MCRLSTFLTEDVLENALAFADVPTLRLTWENMHPNLCDT